MISSISYSHNHRIPNPIFYCVPVTEKYVCSTVKTKYAKNFSQNLAIINNDRLHSIILRLQPHMSVLSVKSLDRGLEKNGYIRRDPTKPRAIEICDDNFQMVRTEMVSIPVVGQVAAGQPILAQENIEEYFPIPADVVPRGESFILKVKGECTVSQISLTVGGYPFFKISSLI